MRFTFGQGEFLFPGRLIEKPKKFIGIHVYLWAWTPASTPRLVRNSAMAFLARARNY